MLAVSDTSAICNLAAIGRLPLLRTEFREVLIPPAVVEELSALSNMGARREIQAATREGWLAERMISDYRIVGLLTPKLHKGEAEAIALALEVRPTAILLDEQDGRDAAARLGLRVTGILGVLLRAKKEGRIDSFQREVDALRSGAGFFIAKRLELLLLAEAGELSR